MVVMALVTTFMTTPVVLYVYPEWYQKQTMVDESPVLDNRVDFISQIDEKGSIVSSIEHKRYCVITMLNRIESVPSMMALIQLFKRDRVNVSAEMHALRLLELTERTSVVMKYKDLRESERQDPILNVFRTFANLISMKSLETHLDYCSSTEYIKTVSDYGSKVNADLILLPWINRYLINNENHAFSLADADVTATPDVEFVNQAFSTIHHCTTGLFIDRGFGQVHDGETSSLVQIMVLYREECEDDKAGLLFALQLQMYKKVDLTIIRKGPETGALLYATEESIKQCIEDHNVDKLFTNGSNSSSHVSCQFVPDLTGSGITRHLTRPLDKHDLVILGRRYGGTSIDEDEDYENALGNLGFSVLKNGTKNTSVLIIQSASSK